MYAVHVPIVVVYSCHMAKRKSSRKRIHQDILENLDVNTYTVGRTWHQPFFRVMSWKEDDRKRVEVLIESDNGCVRLTDEDARSLIRVLVKHARVTTGV